MTTAPAEPGRPGAEADDLRSIVTAHIAGLRRYALLLIGDPAEADDLVQECLVRACAQTRPWRRINDPRAYLFTILHNAHVSRRRRMPTREVPLDEATRAGTPAPQPGRMALRDMARALARLPEEQREVVLLVGLEGMSYREAAAVLDVPVGTIMSRLSRGREALRRLMAGEGGRPVRVVR